MSAPSRSQIRALGIAAFERGDMATFDLTTIALDWVETPSVVEARRACADKIAAEVVASASRVTPKDLTDKMIRDAMALLPEGHYSTQWYLDALGSHDHPQRRLNARQCVCDAINTREER